MANLLTDEVKQKFDRDLFNRRLVLAGLAWGLLFLIIAIILGAFWASLFIRNSGWANISPVASHKLSEIGNASDTTAWLKKIDSQTKILNSYWSEPLVSGIVAKTLSLKPADIKITGLTIERGDAGGPVKLALAGLADSRTGLVNYVNLLRQANFFTKVDLPVESLLNNQGGQFVINLEK